VSTAAREGGGILSPLDWEGSLREKETSGQARKGVKDSELYLNLTAADPVSDYEEEAVLKVNPPTIQNQCDRCCRSTVKPPDEKPSWSGGDPVARFTGGP